MQFEFPGTLAVPDGRYLARDGSGGEQGQRVLVVETDGAPPPPRRRRRVKQAEPGEKSASLPLTRVTAVRAQEPFESAEEASHWLEQTVAADDSTEAAIDEAIALLNRALHAQAIASADPSGAELGAGRAAVVRIGHGSGKEVASGRFTEAKALDARTAGSRRHQRDDQLRPQERVAAVLGGRESLDACESLILRARADLDAGRRREAALQLRVGLEAMLVELDGALADPGHDEDMTELEGRRSEAGAAANAALRGDLSVEEEHRVTELVELCERVLRRRRVLRG
ncbi:MAG TPA: hypothetical protein VFM94_10095 [Solirubrobacterales bacterium]|nr:hypothetical protein [Solirubrobacterales bacterium]